MKKTLLFIAGFLFSATVYGQIGINTPLPKATFDVVSKTINGTAPEGIIAPRLSGDVLHTADTNSVYGAAQDGTLAFVTAPPLVSNRIGQTISIDERGYYYYDFPANKWIKVFCAGQSSPVISALQCSSAVTTGSLTSGQPASGVSTSVPYTGGNGGIYPAVSFTSTGVTGLTASLPSGVLNTGNGNLVFAITGTPSGVGTASFAISLGGQSCTLSISVGSNSAVVTALNCAGGATTGSLTSGLPASGVSRTVPYSGGNGGSYSSQSVASTGVTGLTASLSAGTIAASGTLTYTITGTPSGSGTANFAIVFGGQSCSFSIPVGASLATGSGSLAGKTCFDVVMVNNGSDCGTLVSRLSQKADFSQTATNTQTYTFTPTSTVSNVRFVYVNTNGQVINSLSGGNSGNNISGPVTATVNYNTALNSLASGTTRANALTAQIIVVYNNTANNTGTDVQLTLTVNVQDCACCGAFIAPGVFKNFMCQNLGADMTADPFTPSNLIHGAKYQWGYKPSNPLVSDSRYYTQSDDQANAGAIAGWNGTALPDGSWSDTSKTVNDPCPAGYRVPTQVQWQGVIDNNTATNIGTFTDSPTNYGSAKKFGTTLLLPAAGYRVYSTGTLTYRGYLGYYWSSTQYPAAYSYFLYFHGLGVGLYNNPRATGFSIRCLSE